MEQTNQVTHHNSSNKEKQNIREESQNQPYVSQVNIQDLNIPNYLDRKCSMR